MPYGPEDPSREHEISEWKLHRDPTIQLKENIVTKSPELLHVCSIVLISYKTDS